MFSLQTSHNKQQRTVKPVTQIAAQLRASHCAGRYVASLSNGHG